MKNKWLSAIFFLVILLVVFVRLRIINMPLERDEGEYAYMAGLLLKGVPLYQYAYTMKFPGVYICHAVTMFLFGSNISGIHLGLLVVNVGSILIFYKLLRNLFNPVIAAAAGAVFAVLSLSKSVLGFASHATHYVMFMALAGFLILFYAVKKGKRYLYFLSGLAMGAAFLVKQSGGIFTAYAILAAIFCAYTDGKSKFREKNIKVVSLLSGVILPVAAVFLWMWKGGVFAKFWFWCFEYLHKYAFQVPLSYALPALMDALKGVIGWYFPIWILAAGGFVISVFFNKNLKNRKLLLISFFAFSFLTVMPGFYFREHYFITFLPAVALMAGIFLDYLNSVSKKNFLTAGILIISLLPGLIGERGYLFSKDPVALTRERYLPNPFVESVAVADFIRANTGDGDSIAIVGSEPQILFYSGRRSATGYIYTYPLMEKHPYSLTMQKEMAGEIERAMPEICVFVKIETSWMRLPGSEGFIFDWFKGYAAKNYRLVGVADIMKERTIYKWGDEAPAYKPRSPFNLFIYKRNL